MQASKLVGTLINAPGKETGKGTKFAKVTKLSQLFTAKTEVHEQGMLWYRTIRQEGGRWCLVLINQQKITFSHGKSPDSLTMGMTLVPRRGGRGGKGVRRCMWEMLGRSARFLAGCPNRPAWKRNALGMGCDRAGRRALGPGRDTEPEQFFITQVIGYLVKLLGIMPKIKLKGELIT